MQTSTYRNFISTELTALCFGILAITFAPILIKVSSQELGANAIIFHRFWVATLALGIWNQIKIGQNKENKSNSEHLQPKTKESWLLLLGAGIADAFCMVAWAWSIEHTSIAHSTLLHNLTPIFTTFGGWLFFGQYFERKFLLGVAITICGSICISVEDWQIASGSLIGDQAALFSAILYSVRLLAIERLRDKLSTATIILWISLITTLAVIPVALLFEERIFPSSWFLWFAVILQGLLCEVIGQGAIAYSLKKLSSGFVSLCLLLEPAFAAILAWFIFAQELSVLDLFAFPVILLGIYLAKSSQGAKKGES